MTADRRVTVPDAVQRNDLAAFVERALRLDDAAVIRLRRRDDGLLAAWVNTGFDVLAVRVVKGQLGTPDLSCGADQLARGLREANVAGHIDPGYSMDSGWRETRSASASIQRAHRSKAWTPRRSPPSPEH